MKRKARRTLFWLCLFVSHGDQRIIQTSEAKFEQALIDSVFEVAADTLFSRKANS